MIMHYCVAVITYAVYYSVIRTSKCTLEVTAEHNYFEI